VTDAERPSSSAHSADPRVEALLVEFGRLVDAGQEPELERFVAAQLAELRDALRAGCRELLEVRDAVRRMQAAEAQPAGLAADGSDPLLGKELGGWLLVAPIGEGGMGRVYRARHVATAREVAIKVLPRGHAISPSRLERFKREAAGAQRLHHPGIVEIFETHLEGDLCWYAMELVAGTSLGDRIRALRQQPSDQATGVPRVPPAWIRESAEIAAGVAEALDHVHAQGLVHRDVKPDNVLVDRAGAPKLLDFGLALDRGNDSITRTHDVVGTARYMSPEQVRGGHDAVDARSDVFALGIVLYEMLTLRRPFDGATPEKVLDAILQGIAAPIRKLQPEVPRDLETICFKALERRPEHRYPTAAAMAADLRRFLQFVAIEASPPPLARRAATWVRLRRERLIGVAVGAAALTAWFLWREHRAALDRLPKVSIACDEHDRGLEVVAKRIDPMTGRPVESRPFGELPLEEEPIEPGLWRFVVEKPGVGFAEMTRIVSTEDVAMRAWIVPTAKARAGMNRFEGGKFIFGAQWSGDPAYFDADQEVDAFWIAAQETSVGAFEEYLAAMDRAGIAVARPGWWGEGIDPALRRLPMTSLTYEELIGFVEWSGARLATEFEWERAARGVDGRRYPQGEDAAPILARFAELAAGMAAGPADRVDDQRFRALVPVDDCPDFLRTPDGLFHMLGNATEWTESPFLEVGPRGLEVSWGNLTTKGGSTLRMRDPETLKNGLTITYSPLIRSRIGEAGIRLAKSDVP